MNNRTGRAFLPGRARANWKGWNNRFPKRPDGITLTSPEGRVICYLENHSNRFCSHEELMQHCKIVSKKKLYNVICKLRGVMLSNSNQAIRLLSEKEGYKLWSDGSLQTNHPSP